MWVSEWSARWLWVQCVPNMIHCIQLCPLYTPLKDNPTTADIITNASPRPPDHSGDDVMRYALQEHTDGDVDLCEFSSPVVHFGSVVAGDVALVSCGWRTYFPPLSFTVTHIIASDSCTEDWGACLLRGTVVQQHTYSDKMLSLSPTLMAQSPGPLDG